MICHNSIRHVNELRILLLNLSRIRASPRNLLNSIKEWDKDISVVVGIHPLKDGGETFKSHTGIDVLGGERTEGTVGLAVELDEDVVPDFNDVGEVGVD